MAEPTLFEPIRVGPCLLRHRVAMAPLTRFRAHDDHTPSEIARQYYAQRASVPGTLIVTEATFISARAGGYRNVPGIYTRSHVEAWSRIAEAVHSKGSSVFLQLWSLGRAARPDVLASEPDGPFPVVSSSAVPLSSRKGAAVPQPLTIGEIRSWIQDYAATAERAVKEAGLDGVEIHSANGYLPDQFLQRCSNQRTDEYGGERVEDRCRFVLEAVGAMCERVGQGRVGIRISPWSKFQDMGAEDPRPTFSHLVDRLRLEFPDLAYLHVVEPRHHGDKSTDDRILETGEDSEWVRETWQAGPPNARAFLTAGGYDRDSAIERAKGERTVVVFGRPFVSNPDLPARLRAGDPLAPYDRKTFYTPGPEAAEGYTTYGFAGHGRPESKL